MLGASDTQTVGTEIHYTLKKRVSRRWGLHREWEDLFLLHISLLPQQADNRRRPISTHSLKLH